MSIVEITGLQKRFTSRGEDVLAVDDVNLSIGTGEFVSLLGPSGCGKTTTLRAIAGLDVPTAGQISIAGQVVCNVEAGIFVPPEERGLGMVFQSYAIWPHMTVMDNVAFPLKSGVGKRARYSSREIEEMVKDMLAVVDCQHLADRYPSELSGGQQQRVALARALVYGPRLLLFDEPLSNLDAKLRERMRLELRRLQERLEFSAIYVTHDREEALALSDRIVIMQGGRILQEGTPIQCFGEPMSDFVADFMGPVNFLDVESVQVGPSETLLGTEIGAVRCRTRDLPGEGPYRVAVRPGAMEFCADADRLDGRNQFPAIVDHVTYLGDRAIVQVRVGPKELHIYRAPDRLPEVGSEVTVGFGADSCRVVQRI